MNGTATIAVGGIGAAVGQSVLRAARASKRGYRLVGMDLDPDARHVFPDVPFRQALHFRNPDYLEDYADFLAREKVDLVFVGSEGEMLHLAGEPQRELESRTGARFALSDPQALAVGMDKLLSMELLAKTGLDHPRTRLLQDDWEASLAFAREVGFPCMVKSRRAGPLCVADNEENLRRLFRTYPEAVLQEYLGDENSREYTVGLFCTREDGPVASYCMRRQLLHSLTWRGAYEPNPAVEAQARAAAQALGAVGSVNVQLREHKGRFVIHEFNVRCSSTAVFRALSGWNEIDMAVDFFVHGRRPEPPGPVIPGRAVRFFEERWVPDAR